MPGLHVETDYLSERGLVARRRIHVGEKTIDTPTAATPIGRGAQQDTPAEASRGVNELYRTVSTAKLEQSMRAESSAIADALGRDYRRTNDDEVTIAFPSYQDAHAIGHQEMAHLIDLFEPHTDVLPVPLMPDLVGSIDTDDGVNASAFQSHQSTIERFIEMAHQRAPGTPIMGVIPPLGWEYVEDLLEVYGRNEIRAFCLNLDRRRITAGRQVAMVTPLMRHLARRDIAEGVLTYLINPDPYGSKLSEGYRPAADLVSYGMGIDIVGDCHVPPGGFGEDDEGDLEEDTPTTFRLLNKRTFVYEDIPLTELKDRLSGATGFDLDRVVRRCQRSPEHARYDMQALVNKEQMALAARDLRQQSRDEVFDHLTTKAGVTDDTVAAYEQVRDGFDDGSAQTGLSDF